MPKREEFLIDVGRPAYDVLQAVGPVRMLLRYPRFEEVEQITESFGSALKLIDGEHRIIPPIKKVKEYGEALVNLAKGLNPDSPATFTVVEVEPPNSETVIHHNPRFRAIVRKANGKSVSQQSLEGGSIRNINSDPEVFEEDWELPDQPDEAE